MIKEYKRSNKEEFIIVNIGTDKCIGDSFGPLLGTLLEEINYSLPVYGTLEKPIQALNLHQRLEEIYEKHPNAFILATDACLGEDVGEFKLRHIPIHPGKGINKRLPAVGDMSLIFITHGVSNYSFELFESVRLNFIYSYTKSLIPFFEELERNIYKEEEIDIYDFEIMS